MTLPVWVIIVLGLAPFVGAGAGAWWARSRVERAFKKGWSEATKQAWDQANERIRRAEAAAEEKIRVRMKAWTDHQTRMNNPTWDTFDKLEKELFGGQK